MYRDWGQQESSLMVRHDWMWCLEGLCDAGRWIVKVNLDAFLFGPRGSFIMGRKHNRVAPLLQLPWFTSSVTSPPPYTLARDGRKLNNGQK